MGFLKDVSVSKVSFVRKAANKRKFLLLKSEDCGDNDNNSDNVDNNDNKEMYTPMRKEVKDAILTIFKNAEPTATSADIITVLKSNVELKLSEQEMTEATDYVDFVKMASVNINVNPNTGIEKKEETAEMKKEDTVDSNSNNVELMKQVQNLTAQLAELNKSAQRNSIVTWLQKECAFAAIDIEKTADAILNMQSVDPASAELFKDSLKKSSTVLENAPILREVGNSTDALLKSESNGFELIRKFNNGVTELKKSSDGKSPSAESIVNLIKSFGSEWTTYRFAHARRAAVREQ